MRWLFVCQINPIFPPAHAPLHFSKQSAEIVSVRFELGIHGSVYLRLKWE